MSNQVELPRLDGADASPDHDKKDAIARQHAPMDRKNLGQATFFERWTFSWLSWLFVLGSSKPLQEEDLAPLSSKDKAQGLREAAEGVFRSKDLEAAKLGQTLPISFFSVLYAVHKQLFFRGCVYKLFNDLLGVSLPLQIYFILSFLEDEDGDDWPEWSGYALAALLFVSSMLKSFLENQFFAIGMQLSIRVRATIASLVYNKSLRLSSSARNASTTGKIVNLMQLDAERLAEICVQLPMLIFGPMQLVMYMGMLFYFLGWSAAAGLFTMPFLIMVQGRLMQLFGKYRRGMVKHTDERVKSTNEALVSIRAIKMYAWEESFMDRIIGVREQGELVYLLKAALARSLNMAAINSAPTIVLAVTFLFYSLVADEEMTASTIFTAISIFDRIRFPLIFIPMILAQYVEARVSLDRLTAFMAGAEVTEDLVEYPPADAVNGAPVLAVEDKAEEDEPEAEDDDQQRAKEESAPTKPPGKTASQVVLVPKETDKVDVNKIWVNRKPLLVDEETRRANAPPPLPEDVSIRIRGGSFRYDQHSPALHEIDLDIPKGLLTVIVGEVGSSKSSLCLAMLNELDRTSGSVQRAGTVSYVAQEAWILNRTLRENITFAREHEERRYKRILHVCQLEEDLSVLPDGDLTEIGERGINLSGGQKQRVSIARAAYSGSDVVILDDPLSALDAEVGRRVFEDCVLGELAHTTRVMVANQLHFLQQADRVVVMDSKMVDGARVGYIRESGTFEELMAAGLDFAALMARHGEEDGDDDDGDGAGDEPADEVTQSRHSAELSGPHETKSRKSQTRKGSTDKEPKAAKVLMTTEERQVGSVDWKYYAAYIKATKSYAIVILCALSFILGQASSIVAVFWVSYWTEKTDEEGSDPDPGDEFYIGVYSAIVLLQALMAFVRMFSLMYLGIRAGKTLHNDTLKSVFNAPTFFFDTTPVGRIVSRFAKDLDSVDNLVPIVINWFVFASMSVLVSLVVITLITPYFAIALLPLAYMYVRVLNYYRSSSRELKRIDSISRSPVYAHFSATLGGLSTIRAYGVDETFIHENERALDRNHRATFCLKFGDRWLSMRLEVVGNIIVACAAIFAVQARGDLFAGLAGVSLTMALGVTGLLGWSVRQFANLEQTMNSVERLIYYATEVPQEAAREIPETRPDDSWPQSGEIVCKDMDVRYRDDLELVLKQVSFHVNQREKVGALGRTGSGKSTTLLALMRIVELSAGQILIDGVDIATIGLRDLRSRLSIIPQHPILFSGSVRFNLDPTGQATDEELWTALEKTRLKPVIEATPDKLDHQVAEYGANFSAGQRQLLCLGRALLRQSRVLLLDEATSSIDFETDRMIQRVIRDEFQDRTVLTIAHRLNTIIDSDRLLVLDQGRVAEFDSPENLLAQPDSVFSQLVEQMGASAAKSLREAASARGVDDAAVGADDEE